LRHDRNPLSANGAGKTTLVRGILRHMGWTGAVKGRLRAGNIITRLYFITLILSLSTIE
jgi:hypothetical protein